ncbi:MAG: hypothetical protein DRG78_23595 [Epsilonproteobacteria bacterium]|nr:MAG: hypothetical protein DRG78_23595 [Campylobacterota bacterium]
MERIEDSDLLKELDDMTMSHKKNMMQIAAFQTMTDAIYGINIAKIKEFAMIKDASITKGMSDNPNIMGMAVLRGHPFPLVNMLKWLGNTDPENEKLENYNILVLTEFNQSLVAFPVSKILTIASKSSEDLERTDTTDNKITYITRIDTNKARSKKRRKKRGKRAKAEEAEKVVITRNEEESDEKICFVLDVEKMLDEVFPEISGHKLHDFEALGKGKIKSRKTLAILEDSPVAIKILEKTFEHSGLDILYFNNGFEFKAWHVKNPEKVKDLGCVITDVEMPMMDGYKVVEYIRSKDKKLPIIVNTSMSNIGVVKKLEDMGANLFVPKTEPTKIYDAVTRFMEVE